MANMSYCRFENTANDLEDCFEHMGDDINELSKSETKYRLSIIQTAKEIIEDFGHEIGCEIAEIED
jgi:hypothetical protein